jgi:hypothetical protein
LATGLRDTVHAPDLAGSRAFFGAAYKAEYPWLSLLLAGLVLGALSIAATRAAHPREPAGKLRARLLCAPQRPRAAKRNRVIGVHTHCAIR